jgi:hypothetical protein
MRHFYCIAYFKASQQLSLNIYGPLEKTLENGQHFHWEPNEVALTVKTSWADSIWA